MQPNYSSLERCQKILVGLEAEHCRSLEMQTERKRERVISTGNNVGQVLRTDIVNYPSKSSHNPKLPLKPSSSEVSMCEPWLNTQYVPSHPDLLHTLPNQLRLESVGLGGRGAIELLNFSIVKREDLPRILVCRRASLLSIFLCWSNIVHNAKTDDRLRNIDHLPDHPIVSYTPL